MMSRWCDQSIPDERHSAFSSGPLEVAVLFGTLVAETILGNPSHCCGSGASRSKAKSSALWLKKAGVCGVSCRVGKCNSPFVQATISSGGGPRTWLSQAGAAIASETPLTVAQKRFAAAALNR
jgi:hypothetical protein